MVEIISKKYPSVNKITVDKYLLVLYYNLTEIYQNFLVILQGRGKMESRLDKLKWVAEQIIPHNEREVDYDKLITFSMQTGYQLGRLSAMDDAQQEENKKE